ncbi:uncharacterized protein TNCV_4661141 [Trichonephila clavipes]|uniref:Uncharacterized protein n=1 Tax=Trichonephila clavipes TaxID=2585209 RepID=A0A8X6SGS0_TRICX|nr:uncharacterized protein TNCV_4661141 [Trichonephila clavipes]
MGNPDMTDHSPHTGTGIVLHQIQHSCLSLVAWRPYSSLIFLWVHDEGSAVGQSLVKAFKEGGVGHTTSAQTRPLQSVAPFVRCISVNSTRTGNVPSYYHFVGRRNGVS